MFQGETPASSNRVGPVRNTATKSKRHNPYSRTSPRNNNSASEPVPEPNPIQKIDDYEANLREIRKKEHVFIKADKIRKKKHREDQEAFMTWMERVTLLPAYFWDDTWYNSEWVDEVASVQQMRMKRPSIVLYSPEGGVRGLFL